MDIEKNLILIKNKDKTEDVKICNYNDYKFNIIFNNSNKPYSYNSDNVEFFKNPIEIDLTNTIIEKDGKCIFGVVKALQFSKHTRLIYKGTYKELIENNCINLIKSCLKDKKSKDCFLYLKEIANADILKYKDDNAILGNHYKNLNFIREDSVLADFLNPKEVYEKNKYRKTVLYPFGFNESQKSAVDSAFSNKISIIEGPPGTGKTQTILNIISNVVMEGKSVAVVSNNNSATKNVIEKLQKYGVDFICAFLGNFNNKEEFLNNQGGISSNTSNWHLDNNKRGEILKELSSLGVELDNMLKDKNRLAMLLKEESVISTEKHYFDEYFSENSNNSINFKTIYKLKSMDILTFWTKYEIFAESKVKFSIMSKIINLIKYGIYNQDFYGNSIHNIIVILQKHYYEIKLQEIYTKIEDTKRKLQKYSFDDNMKKYSELSMKIFKSFLKDKYGNSLRKKYDKDDLWKHSEEFIKDYPVILSTTFSLRSSLSRQTVYDYLIIDEASQVNLATGALALSCAKNVVIVGDLNQLLHVVDEQKRIKTDYIFNKFNLNEAYRYSCNSLLSSAIKLFPSVKRTLLKEHYRCHPKIIEFCNKKFYDDELIVLSEIKSNREPFVIYRTVKGNHERDHFNIREIDVIKNEVIPDQNLDITVKDSIGIVSPYKNQVEELTKAFEKTEIKAATVDKFQGQERKIIILSTVDNEISNFSDSPNRLNVAVSRAIEQLIIVTTGNEYKRETNIKDLIKYAEYNSLKIIASHTYSVFDYLYKAYDEKRKEILSKMKRISEHDSEKLMYLLIRKVLSNKLYSAFAVAVHVKLNQIIRNFAILDNEEKKYAMNALTHVDFLIFDNMDKRPVLVVEVDGYKYHNEATEQFKRDIIKDRIFEKYKISLIRFKTTESNEKKRLEDELMKIIRESN